MGSDQLRHLVQFVSAHLHKLGPVDASVAADVRAAHQLYALGKREVYLFRSVIGGNQWQSVAISGNQ